GPSRLSNSSSTGRSGPSGTIQRGGTPGIFLEILFQDDWCTSKLHCSIQIFQTKETNKNQCNRTVCTSCDGLIDQILCNCLWSFPRIKADFHEIHNLPEKCNDQVEAREWISCDTA